MTSLYGFHLSLTPSLISKANGTLVTTVDGTEYLQPANSSGAAFACVHECGT